MLNRLYAPTKNTGKEISAFSTVSDGRMFQPRPFVVQKQGEEKSREQPDLKTALMRAERYGHSLNKMNHARLSAPQAVQPQELENEADIPGTKTAQSEHVPVASQNTGIQRRATAIQLARVNKFSKNTLRKRNTVSANIRYSKQQHTGTVTSDKVRKHVNSKSVRPPKYIRSQVTYISDNGQRKTRYVRVRNPRPKNGKWDAGHAIGQQNGGSGTNIHNMIPQNPTVNRYPLKGRQYTTHYNGKRQHMSWREFEDKIRRKVEKYPTQNINQQVSW